jgi:threonine dehydrogenase-like Zn-dependent dehydrogenase
VLADPFSVSLHAILRTPPPPGGTALVYGVGTLGLLAIAILRALRPTCACSQWRASRTRRGSPRSSAPSACCATSRRSS